MKSLNLTADRCEPHALSLSVSPNHRPDALKLMRAACTCPNNIMPGVVMWAEGRVQMDGHNPELVYACLAGWCLLVSIGAASYSLDSFKEYYGEQEDRERNTRRV